jgi:hypothetical protein
MAYQKIEEAIDEVRKKQEIYLAQGQGQGQRD